MITGALIIPCLDDPLGDVREHGGGELLARRISRQHLGKLHIVAPFDRGSQWRRERSKLGRENF